MAIANPLGIEYSNICYERPQLRVEYREYTWIWKYNPNLIGKDKLPNRPNQKDWTPPLGPEPNPRRSWEWRNVIYIGKDRIPGYRLIYDLPPIAVEPSPRRSWEWRQVDKINKDFITAGRTQYFDLTSPDPRQYREYQWRQVDKLGRDILPFRTDHSLPPRDPREYREWTWKQVDKLGLDVLPKRQLDWPLTPDNRRYVDYSWRQVGYLGSIVMPFRTQDWAFTRPVSWYQDFRLDLLQTTLKPAASIPTNIFYKPMLVTSGHLGFLGMY